MADSRRDAQRSTRPLLRVLIGVAVGLAALNVALLLYWGSGFLLLSLEWYTPAAHTILALAGFSIAFLSFGRYVVLHEPETFWIGLAFGAFAILDVFYVLALPALLPGEESLIGDLPNTSAWLGSLMHTALVFFLLIAPIAPWPRGDARVVRWFPWSMIAGIGFLVAVASLSVALESFLPAIVVNETYTLLSNAFSIVFVSGAAVGAVLSARRYQRTGDALLGWAALTQVLLAFGYVAYLVSAQRFTFWWYWQRVLWIAGFVLILFGLLSEYVGLFRRERERTHELWALQQVTDPALARQGLEPLLHGLLERIVDLMMAHAGAILLLDPAREELVLRAAAGIPLEDVASCRMRIGEDFAGRVAARNAPFWVRDAQADPAIWNAYIRTRGIRAMLGTPMRVGDELIGVVHVDFLVPREFGRREAQLLEVAAERAALAIYQARLVEQLERRATEMDATITSIADGVLIHNSAGDLVRTNPAADNILRYTEEERAKPLAERLAALRMETAEGRPLSLEETPVARGLRGEAMQGVEIILHRPPDRTIWTLVSVAPIRTSDGTLLGSVTTLTDISERKRMEVERERLLQEVQGERSRLQVLIDTAPVGISFHLAPDGRLELINKAGEAILGRPTAPGLAATGIPAYYGAFLPSGEPFPSEELPVSRALRGEICAGIEMLIRQPSGQAIYILVNSAPVRDAGGRIAGAIVAFQDITPIREQERLRDEFISTAAHELKTPVTTIKGYAEMMLKWAPEGRDPREAAAIGMIDAATDRINQRVQEMLDVVRFRKTPAEMRRERFELGELASQVVQRMQTLTKIHTLTLQREGEIPVEADRERIGEVLVTLVDNAIRSSPEGGDIEVRVWVQQGEARVAVTDHGVGIPKERQPHIFEPFYEPVPSGAAGYRGVVALSLYLSKEVIECHKGRMWLESEEGKGSTFYFALPLAERGAMAAEPEAECIPPPAFFLCVIWWYNRPTIVSGGNMSYLEQEINEQPMVLARLLSEESQRAREIARAIQHKGPQFIMVAARGTSDHAATYGKYLLASSCGLPVALAAPSLYTIYKRPPRLNGALVVGISQSGHSPDIVEVVAEGRRQGALTLGITNSPESPLGQAAEYCLPCHAGEERSVAATKTYTAQLTALALLAVAMADDPTMWAELERMPERMEMALGAAPQVQFLVERYRYMESCVTIGRGYNYATALEIALKLKELTYVVAEPYSSADFHHGPIAIIDRGFPALVVAPSGVIFPDLLALMRELRERGAEMVVVSDQESALQMAQSPLKLPAGVPEWLSPIVSVVPGQLFAAALTLTKGLDQDHPRSLHKVTQTI